MRIVMMGTGTFAEPTFKILLESSCQVVSLVTQPDRAGHERGSTRQIGEGMTVIARKHGVPIFQPENIKTPEAVAGVKAFQPELLVVAAYGQILSNELLSAVPRGGINVHASLLPKYRGAAPVAWAIFHGETRTGVTIIRMSVSVDAGDILTQEAIDIRPEETAGELEARLAPVGARLARQVVDQLASGTAAGIKQNPTEVIRAPKLTKEHGLIDWSRPARAVCNQIRAMQPWPTAYTYRCRPGQPPLRLIVHRAGWYESSPGDVLPPGAIVVNAANSHRLIVAAGAGSVVEITKLQPAGKRLMTSAEFLRGRPIEPGDRLGPEA
jgi:methionyl-tRNA formyltransferase